METFLNNSILKFNPDTLNCVRQTYGFDNPARMEEAINILEEWIKKQNHFTQKTFERAYLERTLLASKGSIERAKGQIDTVCTYRSLLPKYFVNYDSKDDLGSLLHNLWVVPLPKLTKDHFRVWVTKLNTSEIKPGEFTLFARWLIIVAEYTIRHDYFNGIIAVYDLRNVNLFEILTKLNISEIRELLAIARKGYGARIKQIHVIHESSVVEIIIQYAKQFLSDKLVSRLQIHRDVEAIHEYVDTSVLPVEYGGTYSSLDILKDEWINVLSSDNNMDYLKKMNQAKTEEKNRVEETFNSLYMGTPGSFRHLIVD